MANHHDHSTDEHIHESSDIEVKPVAKFMAILFIGVGIVMVLMWGIMELLEMRAAKADVARSPVYDTVRVMKEPRLQTHAYDDLKAFRSHEDSLVNGYGWVDKASNKAHVPIEVAIEQLAAKGLPSVPVDSAAAKKHAATYEPGESNGGR
ncbi:MAG: hypothetical protein IPM61_07275 [Chlorobi bacterium]|nr:MAG: hypothetical protein UZ07_CHB004003330 [Chlorobi bacterium OLB7]MBK8911116.1 hypothetical protein [Chlorobiota bacterium]